MQMSKSGIRKPHGEYAPGCSNNYQRCSHLIEIEAWRSLQPLLQAFTKGRRTNHQIIFLGDYAPRLLDHMLKVIFRHPICDRGGFKAKGASGERLHHVEAAAA